MKMSQFTFNRNLNIGSGSQLKRIDSSHSVGSPHTNPSEERKAAVERILNHCSQATNGSRDMQDIITEIRETTNDRIQHLLTKHGIKNCESLADVQNLRVNPVTKQVLPLLERLFTRVGNLQKVQDHLDNNSGSIEILGIVGWDEKCVSGQVNKKANLSQFDTIVFRDTKTRNVFAEQLESSFELFGKQPLSMPSSPQKRGASSPIKSEIRLPEKDDQKLHKALTEHSRLFAVSKENHLITDIYVTESEDKVEIIENTDSLVSIKQDHKKNVNQAAKIFQEEYKDIDSNIKPVNVSDNKRNMLDEQPVTVQAIFKAFLKNMLAEPTADNTSKAKLKSLENNTNVFEASKNQPKKDNNPINKEKRDLINSLIETIDTLNTLTSKSQKIDINNLKNENVESLKKMIKENELKTNQILTHYTDDQTGDKEKLKSFDESWSGSSLKDAPQDIQKVAKHMFLELKNEPEQRSILSLIQGNFSSDGVVKEGSRKYQNCLAFLLELQAQVQSDNTTNDSNQTNPSSHQSNQINNVKDKKLTAVTSGSNLRCGVHSLAMIIAKAPENEKAKILNALKAGDKMKNIKNDIDWQKTLGEIILKQHKNLLNQRLSFQLDDVQLKQELEEANFGALNIQSEKLQKLANELFKDTSIHVSVDTIAGKLDRRIQPKPVSNEQSRKFINQTVHSNNVQCPSNMDWGGRDGISSNSFSNEWLLVELGILDRAGPLNLLDENTLRDSIKTCKKQIEHRVNILANYHKNSNKIDQLNTLREQSLNKVDQLVQEYKQFVAQNISYTKDMKHFRVVNQYGGHWEAESANQGYNVLSFNPLHSVKPKKDSKTKTMEVKPLNLNSLNNVKDINILNKNNTVDIHSTNYKNTQQCTVKYQLPILQALPSKCLTDEQLKEMFSIINTYVANTQYPGENRDICRPNHNGTHALRQVFNLDFFFKMVDKNGTNAMKQLDVLKPGAERNHALFAMYFSRIGRTEECTFSSDPSYVQRSADLYEYFAKQLGFKPDTIEFYKKMILDFCSPSVDFNSDFYKKYGDKAKLVWTGMTLAHEGDLFRCKDNNSAEKDLEKNIDLNPHQVFQPTSNLKDLRTKFSQLCKDNLQVTGDCNHLNKGYSNQLLKQCSNDSDKCYSVLKDNVLKHTQKAI